MLSNKEIWKHSPIVTTLLLEGASIGQLIQMWTTRTAEGQSLWAWLAVEFALLLWFNWYRLFTPDQIIARYTCAFGLVMNFFVILTVIWFRYFQITP